MVITSYRAKNRQYIDDVHLVYMDLLEKEEFKIPKTIYSMMSKKARNNTDKEEVYKGLLRKREGFSARRLSAFRF
jgi:hypothetical protein